jgi:hypothetical protein
MSAEDTIRILLGRGAKGMDELDPSEWRRVAARTAWVRETVARLREAHQAMMDRWDAATGTMSEEEFERLCDEDEAKIAAIRAQIDAVIERDEWPKHLYWKDI